MENRKRSMAAVPAGDEKNTDWSEVATKVAETFSECLPPIVHCVRETTRTEDALDNAAHQEEKKAGSARHLEEFRAVIKFVLENQKELLEAAKVIAAIKEACPEMTKQLI